MKAAALVGALVRAKVDAQGLTRGARYHVTKVVDEHTDFGSFRAVWVRSYGGTEPPRPIYNPAGLLEVERLREEART